MSGNENSTLDLRNNVQEELDFDEQHRRKHEEANSKLIDNYVLYQSSALEYKKYYKLAFVIICLLALVTPVLLLIIFSILMFIDKTLLESYNLLGVIIGDMISFVVALKFLPNIIAKYCFNRKEDDNIQQLFQNVYQHDKDLQNRE